MKIHVILFLAFFFLTSFNSKDVSDNEQKKISTEDPTLVGTWELISRYNYKDNKVVDTFYIADTYRQVKMYSATKVMWSKKMRSDSTEWFGYGSYKLNASKDTLREILDYGSSVMSKLINEKGVFVFELELSENAFVQIEFDQDGNRVTSENYSRIE